MLVTVVYHLASPARRKRLERRLARHGFRMHVGCYDLDLSREELRTLITDLQAYEWGAGDSLRLIEFCRRCERRVWYVGLPPRRPAQAYIIVEDQERIVR
ncbi:MAG: CRISPR-associated endonuclease Cas2 [Calditrichaeota bacterium]|nr:CRISPR-associated endonuclease Cas2 [Calditrichota bacterium]